MPLIIALVIACTIVLLYLVARRTAFPAVSPVTEGPMVQTLDWLVGTPLAERLGKVRPEVAPDGQQSLTVSDLMAAEELLDLVERAGITESELVVLANSTFLVRWRQKL